MALQIFSQIALTCKDTAVTEEFYTKYFGFQRARVIKLPNGDRIVFLKMLDCAVYLELFEAKEKSPVPPATNDGPQYPAVRHLAFKVDNIDAKMAEIGDAAQITQGSQDFGAYIPGWRTVWIADPDGRIVEISQGFVDEKNPSSLSKEQ